MARTVQLLRHDVYCPIKAEIRAVENQSDLRILFIVMISLKIVAYKVYHRMITPNSNIDQSQYERSIQCHTSFILKPRKQNNSVRSSVPARKFCLRAKVAPTTHFWGPDFSSKGQYLSNMQKKRNSWEVK